MKKARIPKSAEASLSQEWNDAAAFALHEYGAWRADHPEKTTRRFFYFLGNGRTSLILPLSLLRSIDLQLREVTKGAWSLVRLYQASLFPASRTPSNHRRFRTIFKELDYEVVQRWLTGSIYAPPPRARRFLLVKVVDNGSPTPTKTTVADGCLFRGGCAAVAFDLGGVTVYESLDALLLATKVQSGMVLEWVDTYE